MSEIITIVGGGLAGLTLGIGLRQRGVPVIVLEAGIYPRHRVCGEFISAGGQRALARLDLLAALQKAGTCPAHSVGFFTEKTDVPVRTLPEAALCVSRYILDDWLAREFQRLGGELRSAARWTGDFGKEIVRASGRRAQTKASGWRLFGLKAHARNVQLAADLEMHFVPSGYVGLCRLAGGEVNICGLFRSETVIPDLAKRWRDWLSGPKNSALHSRLSAAQWVDESFSSVAGICLHPQRATQRTECCVGDALTVIPPVTGDGMSMAFESAELAIAPLTRFSHGDLTWAQAQQEIAEACDRQFTRRLRWAAWLQWALFHPSARSAVLFIAARSDWFWRGIFQRTR